MTHLDCDHASGLHQVKNAKKILVAQDELECAHRNRFVKYQKHWWQDVPLIAFNWNDTEGPFNKSYDLFGDKSIELISIPGHADGLFAVKVTNDEGNFVLLASDAGYAKKSWEEMILPGISLDKKKQKISLQ